MEYEEFNLSVILKVYVNGNSILLTFVKNNICFKS